MMSKWTKMYLEELKGAHEYKELMVKHPDKAQYFQKMHDDEIKHAEYIMKMFPNIEEEIEELKELLNF